MEEEFRRRGAGFVADFVLRALLPPSWLLVGIDVVVVVVVIVSSVVVGIGVVSS